MTETQIPNLSVRDMPMIEAAVIGGVLIEDIEAARAIVMAYQPGDITEPRLQVVDRIARILIARNQRPTAPAVVAEAVDGGHVAGKHQAALTLLLMDLVDVNLNPDSRVAATYARHVVYAAVRRQIATASQRINNATESANFEDLAVIARSEATAIWDALNRLNSMDGASK